MIQLNQKRLAKRIRQLAPLSALALAWLILPELAHAQVGGGGGGGTPITIDTNAIDEASCWLIYFTEGPYGKLLFAASMLGAIVSTALGSVRSGMQCLVVACGAWMIEPAASKFLNYTVNCATYNILPAGGNAN